MNADMHITAQAPGEWCSTISQIALRAHTTPSSMHPMYELLYFIINNLRLIICVACCGLSVATHLQAQEQAGIITKTKKGITSL